MGNENFEFLPDDPQPGPSWQRAGWPLVGGTAEDDLTRALDPTAMKAAVKTAAKQAGAPLDEAALEAELAEGNVRTRSFTSASNQTWGDRPFSRGHLYRILSNPIYLR